MKVIAGIVFILGCAWSYFTGDWMEAALLCTCLMCIAGYLTIKEGGN